MCSSSDERSRNQSYFVLYKPFRLEPVILSGSSMEEGNEVDHKPRRVYEEQQSRPKKKQKSVQPPLLPVKHFADDPPVIIHIPSEHAVPFCNISDYIRDTVVHKVSSLFASRGEGMLTLSDLMNSLRGDTIDVSEKVVLDVLKYLSDLNRIMVDGSGPHENVCIYQI